TGNVLANIKAVFIDQIAGIIRLRPIETEPVVASGFYSACLDDGDPRFHLAKVGNVNHVRSTIARAELPSSAPKWRMQLRGDKAGNRRPGDTECNAAPR